MPDSPLIRSAFSSPTDRAGGKRPVVFDVIGPDRVHSILPDPSLKLVLHVNPTSMRHSYTTNITRTQTHGGWVEEHWGTAPSTIAFEMATGGFVRLYAGLMATTGPTASNAMLPRGSAAENIGGTRRDTIAYDKYLDILSLYKHNGAIYDVHGNIALQGQILVTYDGGSWWGWFENFEVSEDAEKPYQFALTTNFIVDREKHAFKTLYTPPSTLPQGGPEVTSTSTTTNLNTLPLSQSAFRRAEDQDLFGVDLTEIVGPASPPQPAVEPNRSRRR